MIPEVENVSLKGEFEMKFSSPIEPPSFDTLLYYMLKSSETSAKQARNLQREDSSSTLNTQEGNDQDIGISESQTEESKDLNTS